MYLFSFGADGIERLQFAPCEAAIRPLAEADAVRVKAAENVSEQFGISRCLVYSWSRVSDESLSKAAAVRIASALDRRAHVRERFTAHYRRTPKRRPYIGSANQYRKLLYTGRFG